MQWEQLPLYSTEITVNAHKALPSHATPGRFSQIWIYQVLTSGFLSAFE